MNDHLGPDAVPRLMRLIARRLEDYLEGDELALETLGEAIEEQGFSSDDLQSVILAMRAVAGAEPASGWVADAPTRDGARVPSAEERESLSVEAWGYLLDLRTRGTLDAGQFERVMDALSGSAERPVGVELAREVASRVALQTENGGGSTPHGDHEVAH